MHGYVNYKSKDIHRRSAHNSLPGGYQGYYNNGYQNYPMNPGYPASYQTGYGGMSYNNPGGGAYGSGGYPYPSYNPPGYTSYNRMDQKYYWPWQPGYSLSHPNYRMPLFFNG
ncbi:unnamed protein product, partial [Plutella xylostella]